MRFNMFKDEFLRLVKRSYYWVMAAGIAGVKFLAVFSYEGDFEKFLNGEALAAGYTVMDIDSSISWFSYISYAIPCLCACAVAGGVVEDIESGRYNYVLPRSGCLGYAVSKAGALAAAGFCCMVLGNILFYAAEMILLGLPLADELNAMSGYPVFEDGNYLLYLAACTFQFALFGTALSLLTMLVSLWMRDRKMIVVLPAIMMYVIAYFWPVEPVWADPRYLYWGVPVSYEGMMAYCLRALAATLLVLMVSVAVLGIRVRLWRRG